MKVVRVVVLIFRNLIPKTAFAAQMIDLGLPQIVQSLKAQAWSDEVIICLIFKMLLNSLVQSKLPGKFKVPLSTMPFQFLSSHWMSEMAVLFRKCVTSFAIGLRFLAVKKCVYLFYFPIFIFNFNQS